MKDKIHVTWDEGRGNATIILDKFFPCAKKTFQALLDTMIDLDYGHRTQLREDLREFFEEKIAMFDELQMEKVKEENEAENLLGYNMTLIENHSYYSQSQKEQSQRNIKRYSKELEVLGKEEKTIINKRKKYERLLKVL